jgi:hypothetical protein
MRARDWQPNFFEALRVSGNVRAACRAAGIGRTIVYRYRERNLAFARRWEEALEEATDVLDAVARQRAVAGSDALLMFLLKAHRPEVYGDRMRLTVQQLREETRRIGRELGATDAEIEDGVAEAERLLLRRRAEGRRSTPS